MKKVLMILGIILLLGFLALVGVMITFYFIGKKEDKMSIEEVMDDMYKEQSIKNKTSYVIVSVVDDKVSYYTYGINSLKKTPSDSTTVFDIASLGKLFVSTVLKNLHEENRIDIDAPIAPFFKDYVKDISHFSDVTYRDLINHTSGLPGLPQNMLDKMSGVNELENPYSVLNRQDVFNYLETCKDRTTKGEHVYSNFGYGLIGISLELQLKESFDSIMHKNLFSKLGMQATHIPKEGVLPPNLIPGYYKNKSAEFWFDNVLPASGSFVSNAEDISKFLAYQLGDEKAMNLSSDMGGWEYSEKMLNQPEYYWHNGMSGGYYSYLAIDRKNKIGVAILSNEADIIMFKQVKTFGTIRTKARKNKLHNTTP